MQIGFNRIDYSVFSDTCQIQHQGTGICFRFSRGRRLVQLGPDRTSDPDYVATETGARAVLDAWGDAIDW